MHQVSGGDIREVDAFNRLNAPFVGSMRVERGNQMANLFTGRLSNGSTIVGAAVQHRFGDPSEEKVATEIAGAYAKQSGGIDQLDVQHLMGRVTQNLNSPWMKLNEEVRLRFESSVQGVIDSTYTGWMNGNAGARLERETDTSKIGARVSTQYSGGAQDIRDGFQYGMFHNLTYVSVDGEKKLNPEWAGVFDAAVGFRHFGPQIMTSVGVRKADTTIRAGYEGALRSDVPAIMPGMSRKVFAEADTDVKGWSLSATYLQPLDRMGRRNPTVQGSATKVFGKKK
jgi:hypothetical protein